MCARVCMPSARRFAERFSRISSPSFCLQKSTSGAIIVFAEDVLLSLFALPPASSSSSAAGAFAVDAHSAKRTPRCPLSLPVHVCLFSRQTLSLHASCISENPFHFLPAHHFRKHACMLAPPVSLTQSLLIREASTLRRRRRCLRSSIAKHVSLFCLERLRDVPCVK